MRSQDDFTRLIIAGLVDADIPYMVAGAFLTNLCGQPRATHDTDIVIDCPATNLDAFAKGLQSEMYVSEQAMREAAAQRSLFNVIDTHSGWKADMIIRKDRPFSIEEFSRRRQIEFQGQTLSVASPEDAILSKLEWAQKSDSERQLRDAASIVSVQRDHLDFDYLRKWADELGVGQALLAVERDVDSLGESEAV